MKLRVMENYLPKSKSMLVIIICSISFCSATFGQSIPDPLFHFSFDGNAKDSVGGTVVESQDSFSWDKPVVETKQVEFDGNALFVPGIRGKGSYTFRTPSLNYEEFTVLLRIKPVCRPNDRINLVTGGYWMRWFTMFREDSGNLCITLNNERVVNKIPVSIDPDKWSLIVCSVDLNRKVVSTYVDGKSYPNFHLPADFQLNLLAPKWRKKFEQQEKHWLFDNRAFNRLCKGSIDEFMVFNSVVAPEVAINYFSLSNLEELILGDGRAPEKRRNNVLFLRKKRLMEANLLRAGLSASDQGLVEILKSFSSDAAAQEYISQLIHDLGDDNYEKRNSAYFRLMILGAPALAQLKDAQQATDVAEVAYRTAGLVNKISKPPVPNSSPDVNATLAYISEFPNRVYLSYLFSCLAATKNESSRINICKTITECSGREDRRLIREYLSNSDKWLRLGAICALSRLPKHGSLREDLEPFLSDKDELIQLSAVSALKEVLPGSIQVPLQKLLKSQNLKVRRIANLLSASETNDRKIERSCR